MYRYVATDMSPDRKVSTPQKYWEIIQPKFGNLSGAVPLQVRLDLTIMMVKGWPSLPKFTNCTVGPWSAAMPGTEPIKESFISKKIDSAQITMAITESTRHQTYTDSSDTKTSWIRCNKQRWNIMFFWVNLRLQLTCVWSPMCDGSSKKPSVYTKTACRLNRFLWPLFSL